MWLRQMRRAPNGHQCVKFTLVPVAFVLLQPWQFWGEGRKRVSRLRAEEGEGLTMYLLVLSTNKHQDEGHDIRDRSDAMFRVMVT